PLADLEQIQTRERERDAFHVGAYEREGLGRRTKLFIARWKERRILRCELDGHAHIDRTDAIAFHLDSDRPVIERERQARELHLGRTGIDGYGAPNARPTLVNGHALDRARRRRHRRRHGQTTRSTWVW